MHRREFIKIGLAGTAGLLSEQVSPQVLKAATDFRNLKITAVDVFPLKTGSSLCWFAPMKASPVSESAAR